MNPVPFPIATARPLVLGHRGASALAPENTLAAFRLAMEQGADGFELDVWRCGSGEVVVFHDEDARRVAGAPLRVARTPFRVLRELDVGARSGSSFRGERIPLLAEVLVAFPGAIVNVEMKSGWMPAPGLAREVARVIRGGRAVDRVIVSSFDCGLLAAFRLLAPEIPTGLLVGPGRGWRVREGACTRLLGVPGLHPALGLATDARVGRWHERGLRLVVWTVDAPGEVERLARLGVAAVIADQPGRAREAVRRASGR